MMQIDYKIVRSAKRRKVAITVERDRAVVVRVPEHLGDEDVRRIVTAKRHWIRSKLASDQKYQARAHPPGKEIVNGESAPFLGRDYRIEITETKSGRVELGQVFCVPPAKHTDRREVLREWYIGQAQDKIVPRALRHARELGVEFTDARIVDSRYRWGSCTVGRIVHFNWRLIKAPMFVIDYVVVHELAHLLEPNHTTAFWNIVRAKAATMEKAKAWLKEHGQTLEEDI